MDGDKILALSWNIATEPKLYWELAPNPYSPRALQIISERFPGVSDTDIVKAVVLAEPEGRYDMNFKLLGKVQQVKELSKQKDVVIKINKQLAEFCKQHSKEFSRMPKEFIYDSLSKVVFGTDNLKEIEQRYAQNQRTDFKLSIVNFIEDVQKLNSNLKQKNPALGQTVLIIFFAFLSVILLFYSANNLYKLQVEQRRTKANEQVLAAEVQSERQSFPMRLTIPAINVNAEIQHVGVTPSGEMDVPSNTSDVGWFELGPNPGDNGSAVIAGHVDGENGEYGVFTNLHKLKAGDKLYIENNNGKTTPFVVRESRTYDPGYAEEVFSLSGSAYLNLITCDGVWDGVKKSYSKRLVVFANIVN